MKTVLFRIQVWVYLLAYLTSAYPVRSVPSHPPKQSFSVSHVVSIVVIMQSLSHVWFFVTPGAAAQQAPLFFTVFWSLHKFISIESVMPSSHLILCHPLLLPPIFPSIRVFSIELALHMKWLTYKLLMTVKHCSKCLTCIITFLKLHNNLLK